MGNIQRSNSLCEDNSSQIVDKNTFRKGIINIYQFGEVPLYKNQITNQEYFRHENQFLTSSSSQKQNKVLQALKKINNQCPNLVHIWKIIPQQSFSLCSGKSKVFVFFQYIPTTLKDLIENRKQSFSQIQIYKLFNSLLTAIKHLNQKQSYHGDIAPEFIYFDQSSPKKYKVFDPVYYNPMKSGYYRAQNQSIYCAPEILTNLNEKRTFPLYNHYICDTFSIGLVILYCMTLINPVLAYQNPKKQIDYYYIQSLIRIALKQGFSQRLIKCLRECLLVKNRPTVSQILQNYEFLNISQFDQFKYSLSKKN